MWKQQILEKPLSNEEISDRMFKMLQERQSQDADFRTKYSKTSTVPKWQYQAIEKPLSNEEISDRMFKMLQERQSLPAHVQGTERSPSSLRNSCTASGSGGCLVFAKPH